MYHSARIWPRLQILSPARSSDSSDKKNQKTYTASNVVLKMGGRYEYHARPEYDVTWVAFTHRNPMRAGLVSFRKNWLYWSFPFLFYLTTTSGPSRVDSRFYLRRVGFCGGCQKQNTKNSRSYSCQQRKIPVLLWSIAECEDDGVGISVVNNSYCTILFQYRHAVMISL